MIPKKSKEILEKVIKENDLDKSFTEDAVSFYWSELRRNLTELKYHRITVRKLGIFTIKYWKIDEFVESYKRHLDKGDALTWKEATYRKAMEKQYDNFSKMRDIMDAELTRKQKKKQDRIKYESAKTMGEQIQDNGGTPEQRNQEG